MAKEGDETSKRHRVTEENLAAENELFYLPCPIKNSISLILRNLPRKRLVPFVAQFLIQCLVKLVYFEYFYSELLHLIYGISSCFCKHLLQVL